MVWIFFNVVQCNFTTLASNTPKFKPSTFRYLNISCEGCFAIDAQKIGQIEIRERVGGLYKVVQKLEAPKILPNLEIQAPLSPCVPQQILFVIKYLVDAGKLQTEQKEANYKPTNGWMTEMFNKLNSTICTKNLSIFFPVTIDTFVQHSRNSLVKICLKSVRYTVTSKDGKSTTVADSKVDNLESSDKVNIALEMPGPKDVGAIELMGRDLANRPRCDSTTNPLNPRDHPSTKIENETETSRTEMQKSLGVITSNF